MKSKKWIFGSFILLIFFAITHIFIINFLYKKPQTWIFNAQTKKEKIAQNISSPKILITGGSNVIYGVSAKDLQMRFKIPAVNLGVNAGLEVDYILDIAKRNLKSGDIVILPLEYEHFSKTKDLNRLRIAYILNYDRNYFNSLSLFEQLRYLSAISLDELVLSFFATKNEVNYNSKTINENGDESANFDPQKIASFISRKSHDKAIATTDFAPTFGTQKILDFEKWCQQNEVQMFLTWPSTIYFKEYNQPKYKKYFDDLQNYFGSNGIKTLGAPHDFLFDLRYFYDTNYHLNQEGMKIRTQKLGDLLYNHPKFKKILEQK